MADMGTTEAGDRACMGVVRTCFTRLINICHHIVIQGTIQLRLAKLARFGYLLAQDDMITKFVGRRATQLDTYLVQCQRGLVRRRNALPGFIVFQHAKSR
jgi:hypothetical protein